MPLLTSDQTSKGKSEMTDAELPRKIHMSQLADMTARRLAKHPLTSLNGLLDSEYIGVAVEISFLSFLSKS